MMQCILSKSIHEIEKGQKRLSVFKENIEMIATRQPNCGTPTVLYGLHSGRSLVVVWQ